MANILLHSVHKIGDPTLSQARIFKSISGPSISILYFNFQQNLVNVSTEHWDYGLGGKFAMPSSESIFNILEKTYLECELNRTKIQRAQWIVNQLTSYDVVKNELYNIINKPKSGISQLPSNHHI